MMCYGIRLVAAFECVSDESLFTKSTLEVSKTRPPGPGNRLRVIKRTQCNLPLPRITQSEKYVSLFVPEDYQK